MSKLTVTVIDTTGIQDYVFSSNRLRENIGASYLVSQATKEWAEKALLDLAKELNQKVHIPKRNSLQEIHIGNEDVAAEIVYAGGGNTVLLFANFEYAERFTQILTKRVLQNAPGLNIVVAHDKEFELDKGAFKKKLNQLLEKELAKKKRERVASVPLLGLGVTAACRSTQFPAVNTSEKYIDADEEDIYLISRESEAKLKAVPKANQKLIEKFAGTFNSDIYDFPYRTDYLGRSEGESSYVAIVHADGNGMGNRFQKCGEGKSDKEAIVKMRKLSLSVEDAGINALRKVLEIVHDSIENGEIKGKIGQLPLKKSKNGKYYLPFRPLVYGGDDAIFVCEGRLGLELAAIYLREFEEQKDIEGQPLNLTARAGICVVKAHYPFARAYQIVDELYGAAKKLISQERERLEEDKEYYCSTLDWHFAASGLIGSLGEIRQREYEVPSGNMMMRPIRLKEYDSDDNQWRTWANFISAVQHFNGYFDDVEGNEKWKDRRNKIIALREVLRQGADNTKQFMTTYGIKQLPPFPQIDNLQQEGWGEQNEKYYCGYFDAIEAMDFYMGLKGDNNEQL
ncbi:MULTISPECIES: Cas10/Cmr2 second palm domain-containing protein [unclassified Microcoleus]|uniref:Cas10/Cmr2 second palm domain-containing protein n=1 Tax=unclassified Microcoleus TaxID=2642155 RepID=UPI002FD5D320